MEMSILSHQAASLYARAKAQGIRLRQRNAAGAYALITMD
jgi:hypothetical protein